MTEKKRRYNPAHKDNTRNERTRAREHALLKKLQAVGWDNKSQFLTAIINGKIEPPRKP